MSSYVSKPGKTSTCQNRIFSICQILTLTHFARCQFEAKTRAQLEVTVKSVWCSVVLAHTLHASLGALGLYVKTTLPTLCSKILLHILCQSIAIIPSLSLLFEIFLACDAFSRLLLLNGSTSDGHFVINIHRRQSVVDFFFQTLLHTDWTCYQGMRDPLSWD